MAEPGEEGLDSAVLARSAQFLAVLAMLAENTARIRAQHANAASARDEQATRALRVDRLATHADARALYAPALDRDWQQQAGTLDAARVWAASGAWAASDAEAALAHARAEDRLRVLHPAAMRQFDQFRQDGHDEVAAMRACAHLFIAPGQDTPELDTRHNQAAVPPTKEGLRDVWTADDATAAGHAGTSEHAHTESSRAAAEAATGRAAVRPPTQRPAGPGPSRWTRRTR